MTRQIWTATVASRRSLCMLREDDEATVQCVVLRANGESETVLLAHTRVHSYLGGRLHIVGAIDELDAVAVARVDAECENRHVLPSASFDLPVRGDIVLVRTAGDVATPVDLSHEEVTTCLSNLTFSSTCV